MQKYLLKILIVGGVGIFFLANHALASDIIITTNNLHDATVTASYSQAVMVSGGSAPYTWEITNGSLPDGLSLDTSTGIISGTPTQTGSTPVQITVTDGNEDTPAIQAYWLVVNALPSIDGGLGDATINTPYALTGSIEGSGGTPDYTWSIASGSLPPGLAFWVTTSSRGTGVVGTPTSLGYFPFVVQLTDINGAIATRSFSITVNYAPPIIATSVVDATVSASYSKTLGLTRGLAPFSWSIVSGSLPGGLSLNSSSGVISGTATEVASSSFVVQVVDDETSVATRSLSLSVRSRPVILTNNLPDGAINTPYSQGVAIHGGATPFTWNIVAGDLPSGLTLGSHTGIITGRPTEIGSSSFSVQLTDANGVTSVQSLGLAVNYTPPIITPTDTFHGYVGISYFGIPSSSQVEFTGGVAPFSWSILSGDSDGLSIDSSTGSLSGFPIASGTYNFTVQVTDGDSESDTQEVTLVVHQILTVSTSSLPSGSVDTPYSENINVAGGFGPFTWTLIGSLPAGLSLDASTGEISGTPLVDGYSSFAIQVHDVFGLPSDYQGLDITIDP